MIPIQVQTTNQTVQISIDRSLVPMDFLTDLLHTLEAEYLAKTVDFSDDLLEFGEELKQEWWQHHKHDFLKGTVYESGD